jgi:integrase
MKGSVKKDGTRWYVVVDLPRGPDGRRRQKWHGGYMTRKDAEAAQATIVSNIARGEYVEPSRRTLAEYLDTWLKTTRPTLRPSTFAAYEALLTKHVSPRIGHVPLQKVTASDLDALYADLAGVLAPSSVRKVHAILRKALADAVRKGTLQRNVADAADPPRASKAPRKVWSADQAQRFLAEARDDPLYCVYRLALTTGMRRGEIAGLRWEDVDLDASRLSIRQALVVVGAYDVQVSEPKTARSRRNVALDSATVAALRALYEQIPTSEYVFARDDGTPFHPDYLSAAFGRHAKRAGMPRISFHDLRHTYATMALQAGVHPKVVSERIGHASVAITLDVYSHAVPALEESAAALVASLVD